MTQVIGLSAGPRQQGNSEQVLEAVLEGAADAGAETILVRCADLAMEGCRECGGCDKTGRCVVQDGMQPLYDMLLSADHVAFATPIFFMGVASQGKRVIDRCQALWVRRHRLGEDPHRPERRGLFIATAGGSTDRVFAGARDTVRAFFAEIGVRYWGEIVLRPLEGRGDVAKVEGALERARDIGRALVEGAPGPGVEEERGQG